MDSKVFVHSYWINSIFSLLSPIIIVMLLNKLNALFVQQGDSVFP